MTRNRSFNRRTFIKGSLVIGTSIVIAGTELRFLAAADAAVIAPSVVGCGTWGAQPPTEPITVLPTRPTKIIVHHTATQNTTDYSQARAYQLARSIQQTHFGNGWIDSGQHFTISRGGYVLEGRHRSLEVLQGGQKHVRSAHCEGQNDVAVGIENEGTYSTTLPPQALYDQLVALCAYICEQYGISSSQIYGHRDFNATACPGDELYAKLPQLRLDVAARLGGTPGPTPTPGPSPTPTPAPKTWPLVRRGDSGERVKTVQYLLNAQGYSTPVDGSFSRTTERVVKNFQAAKGLVADGIVGAMTWQALIITTRLGNTGDAVRAIQSQLASRGYTIGVDGNFDPTTETAVKSFQTSKALPADGVVGLDTWNTLVN